MQGERLREALELHKRAAEERRGRFEHLRDLPEKELFDGTSADERFRQELELHRRVVEERRERAERLRGLSEREVFDRANAVPIGGWLRRRASGRSC